MSKLIYAATPFRMESQAGEICDFIERRGHFPLHPLLALPCKRYNPERHSREDIYRVCFGLIDLSDELWIFGIRSGSLKEWIYAKELGKPCRSFVKVFDPRWEEWSKKEEYKIQYGKVLEEVLRMSNLPIALG